MSDDKSTKRILIDTTFLFDQYSKRGIGRVGKEILVRLIPMLVEGNIEVHLAGFETVEQNLIKIGFSQFSIEDLIGKVKFHSFGISVPSGVRNLSRWNKTFKPLIEEINPSLYFAIHFERGLPTANVFARNLNCHPKTAVICHDVIPLKTGKYSNKDFVRNFIKKSFYNILWSGVKNADLIFANSNFTKDEITSIPGIDSLKIKVSYLGISKEFYKETIEINYEDSLISQIKSLYGVEDKSYFLYDSGIESNKGIYELLEVFSNILNAGNEKLPNYLVIIGGDFVKAEGLSAKGKNPAANAILKFAQEKGILQNLIFTDRILDRDLIALLANASFYINLSKYEGFGLGIGQAFAAEVPVIASNNSCYPEISNGAALLVDTSNIEESSKSILKYIASKKPVQDNIQKGKEVVKSYDWDKTAKEYFEALVQLLNK